MSSRKLGFNRVMLPGADIDKYNEDGDTLLVHAVKNNDIDIVKYLIRMGADVDKSLEPDETPLWTAIEYEKGAILEILLNAGVQQTFDYDGFSPLTYCISKGKVEMLKCLVRNGVDVNETDQLDRVPLLLAVKYKNLEIIGSLLDYGAKCTIQTALLKAIEEENLEAVKFLIERGADVNFRSSCGFTPLTKATSVENFPVLRAVVSRGAHVNELDANGRCPLVNCVGLLNSFSVKLLLAYGADVNMTDRDGNSPLGEAVITGYFPMISLLIYHGARWGNIDLKYGHTPMSIIRDTENFQMLHNEITAQDHRKDMKFLLRLVVVDKELRFRKLLIRRGVEIYTVFYTISKMAETRENWKRIQDEIDAKRDILKKTQNL